MLLQKGDITVQDAADPETILWENKGVSLCHKLWHYCCTTALIMCLLVISGGGMMYLQYSEKEVMLMRKSDCQGEEYYDLETTLADFRRPTIYNLGMMNCYCKEMYSSYGKPGLKMLFEDNQQYCKTWFNLFEQ